MIDCFSPTFPSFFVRTKKEKKKLLVGFTLFPSSQVFLLGIQMGVNIVCTLLLTGKHDWSISQVAKCKVKSC